MLMWSENCYSNQILDANMRNLDKDNYMKQLISRKGNVSLVDVPVPMCRPVSFCELTLLGIESF